MTTLTHRDPGPDKKAADMSDSDEAGQPKGADLAVAKGGASPAAAGSTAAGSTAAENFADRRGRHAWVPVSAALLTMLIGLSDIIAIFKPGWPHRLHKLNYLVPGTLTNVARSSDVIIGLIYILLANGLAENYSLSDRVWEVISGLVGVSGPVQWAPEARGDLFNILT